MNTAATDYASAKTSVWWDIENCEVPRGWNAHAIAQNVASALLKMDYGGPVSILAYGDTNLIPNDVQQALSSTGVGLNHVPAGVKDASDKKILVDMCLWAVDNPAPANLMLISGDRDFSYALHQLRMRRYNILLAQPPRASVPLVAAAKYVWLWTSLASGGPPLTSGESSLLHNNGRSVVSNNQVLKHPVVSEQAQSSEPKDSNSNPGGGTKDLKTRENHITDGLPEKKGRNMPQSGKEATSEAVSGRVSDETKKAAFVGCEKAKAIVSTKPIATTELVEPVFCQVCQITCTSKEAYTNHAYSKKHRKAWELLSGKSENMSGRPVVANQEVLEKQKNRKASDSRTKQNADYVCRLCNVACQSPIVFDSHLKGQKHAAMLSQSKALTDSKKLQEKSVGEKDLSKETTVEPQLQSQNVRKDSKLFEKHVVVVNQSEALIDSKKLQDKGVGEKDQPRETREEPPLQSQNSPENSNCFENNVAMMSQSEALISTVKLKEEGVQEKAIQIDSIQKPQSQSQNTRDHTKFFEEPNKDLREKRGPSDHIVKEPSSCTKDGIESANKQLPTGKFIFGDLSCVIEVPEEAGVCVDRIVKPVNLSKEAIEHSGEVKKKNKKEVMVHQERAQGSVSAKLDEPVVCEVCQISCTSKEEYAKHTYGKRHRNNLELQSGKSQKMAEGIAKEVPEKLKKASDSNAKQKADFVCTLCNVACQSPIVFDSHLKGQKHAAMLSQTGAQLKGIRGKDQPSATVGDPGEVKKEKEVLVRQARTAASKLCDRCIVISDSWGLSTVVCDNKAHWANQKHANAAFVVSSDAQSSVSTKPKKEAGDLQPVWCQVCQISCTNKETYRFHTYGKKHRNKLELQSDWSETMSEGLAEPRKEVVDKQKKASDGGVKQKADFICRLCNVACQSPIVFESHLRGQKHAAMLNQTGTQFKGVGEKDQPRETAGEPELQSRSTPENSKCVEKDIAMVNQSEGLINSRKLEGKGVQEKAQLTETAPEPKSQPQNSQEHGEFFEKQKEKLGSSESVGGLRCVFQVPKEARECSDGKTEEHALQKIDAHWFQGAKANNEKLKERNGISESSERFFTELKRESLLHKDTKHPLDVIPESWKLPPAVAGTEKLKDEPKRKLGHGELENESAGRKEVPGGEAVGKEEIKDQADNFWTRLWGKKT